MPSSLAPVRPADPRTGNSPGRGARGAVSGEDGGVDGARRELAEAYGVATEFYGWQGGRADVSDETIVAVLGALGVDATTPQAAVAALAAKRDEPWARILPHCVVTWQGRAATVEVHTGPDDPVEAWIELESGEVRHGLRRLPATAEPREVGGRRVAEVPIAVPDDLPLGYHTLRVRAGGTTASAPLIVTPAWVGIPERAGAGQTWGLATQLYSVRSRRSWGVGDLGDLADLAVWGAAHDAGFVLVNPLHAAEPAAPMEPSPYLPTTRRFANPLYLRVEQIPEYAYLDATAREEVDGLRRSVESRNDADRIDRDAAWSAKRAALRLVYAVPRGPGRELAHQLYRRREGAGLDDFATWSALADAHGADWRTWPAELRRPDAPAVAAFREAHADAVAFHGWLQWVLDEQLDAAQSAAVRAGMSLGVVHDLAVGVDPGGAEAWGLQDVFAQGITVGAPPDAFNQLGQDWSQPPWRPDRLAEHAYAPFRAMVSTVLRHAGGVRVDHVIGLFRLWWVPAGQPPTAGTYVRYDHEALVGILALEAHRAGALVVGEDLGVVEPWVRTYLAERGILGTSILWFERDWDGDGGVLAPQRWREYCLASVTTHDLPPTAGYLAGDHIRLRDSLGLLTRPLAEEEAEAAAERRDWIDEMRRLGTLPADASAGDVEAVVAALHRFLALTPARLACVALTDAVGDRRTQNQPGTLNEYPNWRVPLSGPDGKPLLLEDAMASPRAAALADAVRGR
jgi:4-alpha-glucanotransferase